MDLILSSHSAVQAAAHFSYFRRSGLAPFGIVVAVAIASRAGHCGNTLSKFIVGRGCNVGRPLFVRFSVQDLTVVVAPYIDGVWFHREGTSLNVRFVLEFLATRSDKFRFRRFECFPA
jgi:hypothetical protein